MSFGATGGEIQGMAEALVEIERDVNVKIRQLLEAVGIKTIEYLRSFTGQFAPPIRKGDPPRRRHPTFWADRSGQLAASYSYQVEATADGWVLHLMNSAEYAVHLEARDGYFVLSGVADAGGPVEVALRDAVRLIAPDWVVASYD